ncbi:hypothetical protein [Thalassospira tepidiphila]|uniref:hypothetical protein n=1 Tax=Thalassospira tepidiphila TaxID=393657 RepID=UPI003AA8799E
MSQGKGFFEELTNPADGGKMLKAVFDHIRNYMMCGALMGLGVFIFKHGSMMTQIREIGWVTGPVIFLIGLILYPVNFVVFVRYLDEKKILKNTIFANFLFALVMFFVVIVVGDITHAILFQAIGGM